MSKATEPDNGVVASPSTYEVALSIASMNNIETTSIYLLANGRKIRYNDPAEKKATGLYLFQAHLNMSIAASGAATDFSGKTSKKKLL